MSGWVERACGGITLRERPGDGEIIVLLHGIGSSAASWTPLIPHLPADARVIAWNAPGYGGSRPLAPDWPVAADYADALTGLVEAERLERFTLAGHSLGCLMGASFAAANPGVVARLILASPALGHGASPGGAISGAARKRIDDLEALGPTAFAKARAPRLLHRPTPVELAAVEAEIAKVSMPGYGQAVRMLASGRLTGDCARLTVPTDVIVGAEDAVTPPDAARKAHAAIPEAARGALILVPGAGHALATQAPRALADIITSRQRSLA